MLSNDGNAGQPRGRQLPAVEQLASSRESPSSVLGKVRGDPLATDQSHSTSHHTSHFTTSQTRTSQFTPALSSMGISYALVYSVFILSSRHAKR